MVRAGKLQILEDFGQCWIRCKRSQHGIAFGTRLSSKCWFARVTNDGIAAGGLQNVRRKLLATNARQARLECLCHG